jgi:hypothetical protein
VLKVQISIETANISCVVHQLLVAAANNLDESDDRLIEPDDGLTVQDVSTVKTSIASLVGLPNQLNV